MRKFMWLLMALVAASASVLGAICQNDLPADISGDCKVDMADLSMLAQSWLDSSPIRIEHIYYAAPNGSGDGLTEGSPFKIADFWSVAQPGDVLILLDGLYQGADNMINPPATLQGLPDGRITIKSKNDGGATIDGQNLYNAVRLYRNPFFTLDGFNACNSANSVVHATRSGNLICRKVCAWNARDGNCFVFWAEQGDNCLFEDCAGWGIGRKIFVNTYYGDYCIFRRCWGRWDGCHNIGPKMTFSTYYDCVGGRFENCVATWSAEQMQQNYILKDETSPDGIYRDAYGNTYSYTNFQVQNPHAVFGIDNQWHISDPSYTKVINCLAYTYPCDKYDNYSYTRPGALFHAQPAFTGDFYSMKGCLAWQHNSSQVAYNLTDVDANSIDCRIANNIISGGTVTFGTVDIGSILPLPIADRVKTLTGHDMYKYLPKMSGIYYAEPSGDGDGSYADPMSIAAFLQVVRAGDTLILKDGLYDAVEDMITLPDTASPICGQADKMIVVRAENDGQAILDGQNVRIPVSIYGNDYWKIEGIRCKNSSGHVIMMTGCDNTELSEITSHDAAAGSSLYWFKSCGNILVENCAGWGIANKVFSVGQFCNGITFRYCFANLYGSTSTAYKAGLDATNTDTSNIVIDRCVFLNTVPTDYSNVPYLIICYAANSTVTDTVSRNDGPVNSTHLLRLQGDAAAVPPNCTSSVSNFKAISTNGTVSYGYYLVRCSAANIQSINGGKLTSNCCTVTEGTFDRTPIAVWPMNDRILAERGIDVESLY